MVDAGRTSPKASPCARPTASAWAGSVMNIRVRMTSLALAPAAANAATMISMHRVACAAASGSQEPSGHIGAGPDTTTRSPTRTARLNPIVASNGDPDAMFRRSLTGVGRAGYVLGLAGTAWRSLRTPPTYKSTKIRPTTKYVPTSIPNTHSHLRAPTASHAWRGRRAASIDAHKPTTTRTTTTA